MFRTLTWQFGRQAPGWLRKPSIFSVRSADARAEIRERIELEIARQMARAEPELAFLPGEVDALCKSVTEQVLRTGGDGRVDSIVHNQSRFWLKTLGMARPGRPPVETAGRPELT